MNSKQSILTDRAVRLRQELMGQLVVTSNDLLKSFPIKAYCDELRRSPIVGSYKYVSQDTKNLCAGIIKSSNENTLELYHKLVIVELLFDSIPQIEANNYPKDIEYWYWLTFKAILAKIENKKIHKGSYLFPQDRLFKDLGISTLKLIPTGVRKLHREKLPIKRFLFRNGIKQFVKGLVCILFELKGIQPVFHGHLDSRDRHSMSEFSRDGWIRHYKMAAQLLKSNMDVKGIMGLAWFYDPRLKEISPELAYLKELVVNNGGRLFYVGTSENAVENATRLSMKRKRLYEEGKYLPTSYLYIWPRSKIIQWADNKECLQLQ